MEVETQTLVVSYQTLGVKWMQNDQKDVVVEGGACLCDEENEVQKLQCETQWGNFNDDFVEEGSKRTL